MIPKHIFRAYDIRGIADVDLTNEVVTDIAKAFGTVLKREGKHTVAVGYDHRISSKRIFKALSEGLVSTGITVADLGLVPTPLAYFSVVHLSLDASISITGSHNPPEYNGIKMHLSDRSFYGEEIQNLISLIEKKDFETSSGKIEKTHIVSEYQDYVACHFQFKKKLKVVLDIGHGMAGVVMPDLVKRLGHDVTTLYGNMDSSFPDHHPDPSVPENLVDLQKKVIEIGADIGIAFDGDADRIGIVDEKGNVIDGDKILLIYAREILERKPGATIIGDVKCSKLIYDDIKERGGNPLMCKTGHSNIKTRMKETNALLAGEMSGHIFFKDGWFGFDDAIYAACRMLEIIDNSEKPVSELLSDLPKLFATPEIRFDCPDNIKFDVVEKATKDFKEKYDVIDTDGVRIQFKDGWGLVRASNTQPVLVMRFEAESEERLSEIRKIVENKINYIVGEKK